MTTRLLRFWDALRANFWFVPTLMVASAVGLSFLTLWLDKRLGEGWIAAVDWTYSRGPEGSRAILSTIAGSMVTIASLTFTITIVTLQLASSQFGPRLLRNFVRDRGNQVVLGTFVATFVYCVLILRSVNGTDQNEFVPHASVLTGMGLALASLGVLIYFIHHTAYAIQAESVIAQVGQALRQSIGRLFPEQIGQGADRPPGDAELPEGFERGARAVASTRSDYLQAVEGEKLLKLATRRDLVLRVERRPGQFVVEGGTLILAWPGDRLDEATERELRGAFYFGSRRTDTQDAEFAVDQLVEVAVRALSTGINDPFTAINCVDRIGAALCDLAGRKAPSPYRHDDAGRLRVVAEPTTMAGLADAAFHQVRQASRGNAAVTLRLLETIALVVPLARDPGLREALLRHADLIHRGGQEALPDPADRRDADDRYRSIPGVSRLELAGPGRSP